jgi:hypothetical protein
MRVKLKLISNWKRFLAKAWSVRLLLLTAISSTFPLFVSAIPSVWFASLTMLLAIITVFAQVTDQPSLDRRKASEPVEEDRRA